MALRSFLILAFLAVSAFGQKEFVFVAGPKDHGVPGRHEYGKALALLKGCIDSAGLKGVETKMYSAPLPDASELKNAAVIVLNSSGDRIPKETHAIFPEDATTDHNTYDAPTLERLHKFDGLMKSGVGIVIIHYTTWVNNPTGRKYFMEWAGGYYEDGYSKVVKSTWHVEPAKVKSPILNGIMAPWTYEEEFFTKERLSDDPHRVTLLTGTSDTGVSSDLAWSLERPEGGRGFVMTGADMHKNMLVESHRRLILNGMVWAAKMKVPDGGVSCNVTEDMIK
jgi:hypothetical protein